MCIPDFYWGAMENWGLVTYREIYLLYDEGVSSPLEKYLITYVMAHELAHQVMIHYQHNSCYFNSYHVFSTDKVLLYY